MLRISSARANQVADLVPRNLQRVNARRQKLEYFRVPWCRASICPEYASVLALPVPALPA